MTEQRLDPETLAALLDGTLPPDERQRALDAVARSPDDHELLLLTARLGETLTTAEEREPKGSAAVRPPTPIRRYLTAAAGVLIAASVALALLRPSRSGGDGPLGLAGIPARAVATPGAGALDRAFAGWRENSWATRGDNQSEPRATGFLLGIYAAELEVAALARDTTVVRDRAARIVALLAALDGGGPAAFPYGGPDALLESSGGTRARHEAYVGARQVFSQAGWPDLGAWLEFARLGILSGRAPAVLTDPSAMAELERIRGALGRSEGDPAAAATLRALDTLRATDPASTRLPGMIDSLMARAVR